MEEPVQFRNVPIEEIDPPDVPMRSHPEKGIAKLTASIQKRGQLSPILVRPREGRYQVVFGHRRLLACQKAGLAHVLCRVQDMPDAEAAVQRLSENEHRELVPDLDRIRYFRRLKDDHGMTLEALRDETGIAIGWLSDLLGILDLPPHILARFSGRNKRPFSLKHMVALSKLTGVRAFGMAEALEQIVSKIERHRITKEEARRLVDFVLSDDYRRLPDSVREKLLSSKYLAATDAEALIHPEAYVSRRASAAAAAFSDRDRERIAKEACSEKWPVGEVKKRVEKLLEGRANAAKSRGKKRGKAPDATGQASSAAGRDTATADVAASVGSLRQQVRTLIASLPKVKETLEDLTSVPATDLQDLMTDLRTLRTGLDELPLDGAAPAAVG